MSITLSTVPDLRRLSHFVTVVQLESMTRAAAQLCLTQQAISASIRKLEEQVGRELLYRDGHGVRPTLAGLALYDGALPLIAAASSLVERVRCHETRQRAPFVVGYSAELDEECVLDALFPVRKALPNTAFELHVLTPRALHRSMLRGELDVALRGGIIRDRMFDSAVVSHRRLRIAVGRSHRLATRPAVQIRDLTSEEICVWDMPGESPFTDFIVAMLRYVGIEPRIQQSSFRGAWMSAGTLDSDAVTIVTREAGYVRHGEAVVIDIDDAPLLPVQAFWMRHTESEARAQLVRSGIAHMRI